MSQSTRHDVYGVTVDVTELGGITEQEVRTGSEVRGESSSGGVYPSVKSLVRQKPTARFTTLSVGDALALIGAAGWKITGAGLLLYAYKHAEGGTRESGAEHRKYTIPDGIVVPRTLTVNHDGDATLTYDVLMTSSDGSSAPYTYTDSITVPTAAADTIRYALGPVTLESIALCGKLSLEIDFGIQVDTEGSDAEIWDTYCSISAITPTITLRGKDIAWHHESTGIPLLGKDITQLAPTKTTLYLRKRAAGGTFVADDVAEHVKFAAAGLATMDAAFDGDHGTAAEFSIVAPLLHDGTNNPLVISTASTIG